MACVYTVISKDSFEDDTGPAELVEEDKLIATIQRMLEQPEDWEDDHGIPTHVEVHIDDAR